MSSVVGRIGATVRAADFPVITSRFPVLVRLVTVHLVPGGALRVPVFVDDQAFKEEVRSRTDIVGLISETVSLQPQRGGREFKGLCPFHDDHSPSFMVYPDRQSFK